MISSIVKKHWQILSYLFVSLLVRFPNFKQAVFFTWDNGRDFFAIKNIAQGDITLIGPTTGLEGFFLGPFWYYLGLPGFHLSSGNPYIFLLYFIVITLLALPLFWYLAHLLFSKSKFGAVLTALFLSLLPGSVWGTMRVWNPQIGILLITLLYLSLVKARKNNYYLLASGLIAGLLLQSQFAYGVFFVVALPFFVRYVRKKFDLKELSYALGAFFLTLVPQIVFELKNNFLMTKSLLANLTGTVENNKLSWLSHLKIRPVQLFTSTQDITIRGGEDSRILFGVLLIFMLLGIFIVWSRSKDIVGVKNKYVQPHLFMWRLLTMMAILPYPFYMLWRGNNGFFFDYYVTAHFVLLSPLLVLGLLSVSHLVNTYKSLWKALSFGLLSLILLTSAQFSWTVFLYPNNNAGLEKMDLAVNQVFEWIDEDEQNPGVIKVFTPNVKTEHYDSIIHWKASAFGRTVPAGNVTEELYWYTIIEPAGEQVVLLDDWTKSLEAMGVCVRRKQIGDLLVETWVEASYFVENEKEFTVCQSLD